MDYYEIRKRIYEYDVQRRQKKEEFRQYAVQAKSLYSFIEEYHKNPIGELDDYFNWEKDLWNYGYVYIPAHKSVTGKIVSYFNG